MLQSIHPMEIQKQLEETLGESLTDSCLTTGKTTTLSGKVYFLKTGPVSHTYLCEAHSLREIATAKVIRTPKVIAAGENFLLTEFIESGHADTSFFQTLGIQLARLHRITSEAYGFYEDNYIGANPQSNLPEAKESSDWALFYFNKRLLFQYKLAESRGLVTSDLKSGIHFLEKHTYRILQGSNEPPTLLHGDLWAGNYLCSSQGEPVLIDPAVYYGHRGGRSGHDTAVRRFRTGVLQGLSTNLSLTTTVGVQGESIQAISCTQPFKPVRTELSG